MADEAKAKAEPMAQTSSFRAKANSFLLYALV
jgi:hypothetical protein